MKFLFVHNNFPAQFRHLITHLQENGHNVLFLSLESSGSKIPGIKHIIINPKKSPTMDWENVPLQILGWKKKYDISQYFYSAFQRLQSEGFIPDFVVSHAGWGAGLLIKSVFPAAKLACYAEWWFKWSAEDHIYDSKSKYGAKINDESRQREQFINMYQAAELAYADFIWTPTRYQRKQYPDALSSQMNVIHEGVEIDQEIVNKKNYLTNFVPHAPITYATRGMEIMRGFDHLIPIVGGVLSKDNSRHAVIGGKDKAFYRKLPADVISFAQLAKQEFSRMNIPSGNVTWPGLTSYSNYRRLLSVSGLHIYLTRPFVPSWSLIDAMSSGCLVVASNLECVEEIMRTKNGTLCGMLINHLNHQESIDKIETLLDSPRQQMSLRESAREHAFEEFNCKKQLYKLREYLGL